MRTHKLLATIIAFAIIALVSIIYYGAQTLSPRAYVAPGPSPSSTQPTAAPDIAPAPSTPPVQKPETQQTLEVVLPNANPRPATDAEAQAYTASSSPRIARASLIPPNFLDTTALLYGKTSAIIAERPSAAVPTSIWKLDTATQVISTLVDRKRGTTYVSSPNGAYILLSYLDDQGSLSFFFQTTATGERRPLRFATLPAKCAIRNDKPIVYCGVPLIIPTDATLPDDYFKKHFYTNDRLMMIDFEKLEVTELWSGGSPNAIDILAPAIIGKNLIFANRLDGSLWTIPTNP